MLDRSPLLSLVLFAALPLVAWQQPGADAESYLGNLAPILRSMHEERGFSMDYDHRGKLSLEEWRRRGRAEVARTLSYAPKTVPLDLKVESIEKRRGYELRRISFAGSPHYRIPAYLLIPEGKGPFPGLVALHDHGGYFYHGKEKLVEMPDEHPALTAFKQRAYGGRSYASELARRGYVVLVIDAFYWGERRLQYRTLPPDMQAKLAGLDPAKSDYVLTMNRILQQRTSELNTWLSFCGSNWLGIVNYDDRRSVDLLVSLPDVDPKRVGALGLSGGGYRSTYLTGMEPRLRASVITGWMTSLPTTLDKSTGVHSNLFDAYGLHTSLDHPDVATLGAPDCAVFVQDCARDQLFTREGMDLAANKIRHVYDDLHQSGRFAVKFYDVPHQFNVEMQEDAFRWLDRWLKE